MYKNKPTKNARSYARELINLATGYCKNLRKADHSHYVIISFDKGTNSIKADLNSLYLEIEHSTSSDDPNICSLISAIGFPDYHNSRSGRNMAKPLPNPDRADMLVFCRNKFEAKRIKESVKNLSAKFVKLSVRNAVNASSTIQDVISDLITAYAQDNYGQNGRMYAPILYPLSILENAEAQVRILQSSRHQDNAQTDASNRHKVTKAA